MKRHKARRPDIKAAAPARRADSPLAREGFDNLAQDPRGSDPGFERFRDGARAHVARFTDPRT